MPPHSWTAVRHVYVWRMYSYIVHLSLLYACIRLLHGSCTVRIWCNLSFCLHFSAWVAGLSWWRWRQVDVDRSLPQSSVRYACVQYVAQLIALSRVIEHLDSWLRSQRWKWVIFRDPWPMAHHTVDPWPTWPMTHDLWPLHHFILRKETRTPTPPPSLGRGVALWYWTTLSVLRATNRGLKLSLQLW